MTGKILALDHSVAPPSEPAFGVVYPFPEGSSTLLVNATRDWDHPPVSLPGRTYMERARTLWGELGLPQLTPTSPWHGYSLGYWPAELAEEAERAVRGDFLVNGRLAADRRRPAQDADMRSQGR